METLLPSATSAPSEDDVAAIAALSDGAARNLRITQCYYELSRAFAQRTGPQANWCTFATWASLQAGQTIRGEDLRRTLEERLLHSRGVGAALTGVRHELKRLGVRCEAPALRIQLIDALDPARAAGAAAEAVARGNLKVFAEIGLVFARFLALLGDGDRAGAERVDAERLRAFCDTLRPGEPPDGQQRLREAFAAYAEALATADPRTRAELLFFANLLVGLHEQTRLQPDILAAMEAPFGDADRVRERLLRALLPGWWLRLRLRLARLTRQPLPLDHALDRLVGLAREHARHVVTEALMTLHLPRGKVLRLGRDHDLPFPPLLQRLAHPGLQALLERIDPTPDSAAESGARDWSDLADRMHFITDLFRCYHAWEPLFDPPFLSEQAASH